MSSFSSIKPSSRTAVIIGANGGIGSALVRAVASDRTIDQVHAFSRSSVVFDNPKIITGQIDLCDEQSIITAATTVGQAQLVIVASGILHGKIEDDHRGERPFGPEKSWRNLEPQVMARLFEVNTIGPALVLKHFLPILPRKERAVFAALAARVGSIADNELGGWYAYRASKAALVQIVRTASIELKRKNPDAVCVAMHPGTVETDLSAPFRNNQYERFTPEQSATHLVKVLDQLSPEVSGCHFDWQGQKIPG